MTNLSIAETILTENERLFFRAMWLEASSICTKKEIIEDSLDLENSHNELYCNFEFNDGTGLRFLAKREGEQVLISEECLQVEIIEAS